MNSKKSIFLILLLAGLFMVVVLSLGAGAMKIAPVEILKIAGYQLGLADAKDFTKQQSAVFSIVRLPRVLLGVLIGASLSISGAAMQGLFRNPLADPSLIGISAGAALSAALGIVSMGSWLSSLSIGGSISVLSLFTFLGALVTTWFVYGISQNRGRTSVVTMLLAGIAINAFAGAGTGLLTYVATDDELRSVIFWTLGSLGVPPGTM